MHQQALPRARPGLFAQILRTDDPVHGIALGDAGEIDDNARVGLAHRAGVLVDGHEPRYEARGDRRRARRELAEHRMGEIGRGRSRRRVYGVHSGIGGQFNRVRANN